LLAAPELAAATGWRHGSLARSRLRGNGQLIVDRRHPVHRAGNRLRAIGGGPIRRRSAQSHPAALRTSALISSVFCSTLAIVSSTF